MDIESNTTLERVNEKIKRNLGEEFLTALNNPKTIEIMLNADGILWQECLGEEMRIIGKIPPHKAEAAMRSIASVLDTTITTHKPILEGVLPIDGSRFAGWFPPVVSAPSFSIRKKATAIFKLDQYVESGTMTQQQKEMIVLAVKDHKNILVVGGTGSGKTTLTNAIIREMVNQDPLERIVIIEDTGEIQCAAQNAVLFNTSLEISMTDLLKTTLRARPDRILVGEVRGAEALDLLDAWNTGHEGGAATVHANDALAGLDRLKSLITRNNAAPKEIEPLIGEVVHIVIHIEKTTQGRKINEILSVSGYENNKYRFEYI